MLFTSPPLTLHQFCLLHAALKLFLEDVYQSATVVRSKLTCLLGKEFNLEKLLPGDNIPSVFLSSDLLSVNAAQVCMFY